MRALVRHRAEGLENAQGTSGLGFRCACTGSVLLTVVALVVVEHGHRRLPQRRGLLEDLATQGEDAAR